MPRIEWLLKTKVDARAREFMDTVSKAVDDQLKKSLDAEVKARVSKAIMERLDMSKII